MLSSQGLHARAALFQLIRIFFQNQGFLEVDTPIRQPLLIPEANIIPIRSEKLFLQASPELFMKRLLASGCDKILQICHCFRSGEKGRLHLEEFVMVEWYRIDADYTMLMKDCDDLLRFIDDCFRLQSSSEENKRRNRLTESGFQLQGPGDRLTVRDAFDSFSPVSLRQAMAEDSFEQLLVESVEPNLGCERPLFLYDYPVELGSLAKRSEHDEQIAERFELYVDGVELANGFSELTDGDEQRQRFEKEFSQLEKAGFNWAMPETFLRDLEQIDTAAGIALGFDRLLMLLMGKETISDVVPFAGDDLF